MSLRRDWICKDRHYDVDISAVDRSSECDDRSSVDIIDERSSRCKDRFSVSIVDERSSECKDRFSVSIVDERSSGCRDRHSEVSIVVSIKSGDDDCSIVMINIIFMYISDIDDCKTRNMLIVIRQLYCFHQSCLFHMTENLFNSLWMILNASFLVDIDIHYHDQSISDSCECNIESVYLLQKIQMFSDNKVQKNDRCLVVLKWVNSLVLNAAYINVLVVLLKIMKCAMIKILLCSV